MRRTDPFEPFEPVEPVEPTEPAEPLLHVIKGRYAPRANPNPSHQSLTLYSRRLMTFEYRPTCPADFPVEGIQKLVSRKKTRSA